MTCSQSWLSRVHQYRPPPHAFANHVDSSKDCPHYRVSSALLLSCHDTAVANVALSCTTGSAGHGIALEFRARGYRVIATARAVQKMDSLREAGIECVALDLADSASIQACHAQVKTLLGSQGLDFLVNNAGTSRTSTSPLESG